MEQEKEDAVKKKVEAILFAAGRKVSIDEVTKLCNENKNDVENALHALKKDYDSSNSSLFLIQESDGWKMSVREKYLNVIKDITPNTELNKALLETLAIVAWKQPVLQADVVRIRGSTCYEHIRDLVEMGFITKVKHGRSYVLKPSTRFFDYFDLPSKEAVKEVFKDIEFTDLEKRKGMGIKPGEQQDKIGGMEVYNVEEDKEKGKELKNAEKEMETEKFGRLEVFEEPGEKKEDESEEETKSEETKVEKTVELAEKLVEETEEKGDREESEEGSKEESEEKEDHEEEKEETKENDEESSKAKTKKKGRLSKELEDFAGLDEEEKEGNEDSEENYNEKTGE